MKKKTIKPKKIPSLERIETSLESISNSLKFLVDKEAIINGLSARDITHPTPETAVISEDMLKVHFPKMNLKEIFEESKGKCVNGDPLVWNFKDSWVRNEKFFTEEYTSEGWKELDLKYMGVGKNWNECKALAEKEGKRILNFAEFVYLSWKHPDVVKKLTWYENDVRWTWISTPVDGDVGSAGRWDSDGPSLSRLDARREWDSLALCFSCKDL